MISAASPIRWTFSSAAASALVMGVQLAVLSRFLSASQLGLSALALMILGVAALISDFGIGRILIKEQGDLGPLRTSLYSLELALGVGVWIVIWTSASALSRYYAAPELAPLLRLGSICLLIIPIGHQFYSLLSRDLLFKTLAIIEIVSSMVGLAIAIVAAVRNEGAYAPIWGWAATLSIKYLLIAFVGWRQYPLALAWKVRGLLPHLKFGLYATAENTVSYVSTNIDYLIIGFYLGPQELGYYVLAYQVATFAPQKIAPILARVAFPIFARQQTNASLLRAGYLEFSQLATVLTLPLLAGLLITAPLLVQVVFGVAWERSTPVVQLLTIFGVGRMVVIPSVPLLLAKGRADFAFVSGALYTLTSFFVFLLIVDMGLEAIAGVFAAISCCHAVCMLFLMRWAIGLDIWTYLQSIKTTLAATFLMSVAAYLVVTQAAVSVQPLGRLLAAILIGGVVYATYMAIADRRVALLVQGLFYRPLRAE
ncbi:MOP flippase family protein [Bradyrhizobium iriomotense]|uniref:MOP flippase family protein n=1 Tax=Bradyrhizobium iriomotense TaxID=441950 RepID=UPI001B8A0B54|nr:MOP flippase family protein [Bradyrhizobium iriomotense]MBR0784913.1 MOP flippase family protein [Bradyrhizobium iriomotense]